MKKNYLFLSLIAFFFNYPIRFIGILRLGEIIFFIYLIINIKYVINVIITEKNLKVFLTTFSVWLFLGLISSYINDNLFLETIKGFANVTTLVLTFLSFYTILNKDQDRIFYILIFYGIGNIFFSPYNYGGDKSIGFFFNTSISENNYFDIYIAPFVSPILLSLLLKYPKSLYLLLAILTYSFLAIYFDAKAFGLFFMISIILYFITKKGISISYFSLFFLIIIIPFLLFPVLINLTNYILAINADDGWIYDDTSSVTNNPLAKIGRQDPIIGILAFLDNPIYGHGFNKIENIYTIQAKSLGLISQDYNINKIEYIPVHSHIIQSMVEIGFLGFVIWIPVLLNSFKIFKISINTNLLDKKLFIYIIFFQFIWNLFLSPIMRIDFAISYSIILIFIKNLNSHSIGPLNRL